MLCEMFGVGIFDLGDGFIWGEVCDFFEEVFVDFGMYLGVKFVGWLYFVIIC